MKKFTYLLLIFSANFIFSQDSFINKLISSYSDNALYREKVFLHINKTNYLVNEHIWFSAYIAKDADNSPSLPTTNLEVKLINGKGEVLKKKTVFIKNGIGFGEFSIPEDYQTGNYYLIASTNFMKNFGNKNVFSQEIKINNSVSKVTSTKNIDNNNYDIQVFPESGYLLEGIKNTIGIKTLINGKSYSFSGIIQDSKNNIVANYKENHLGMSKCSFFYSENETYTTTIDINNTKQTINLPKANKTGLVFSLDNTDNKKIKITLKTNTKSLSNLKTEPLSLVFYRNNYICEAYNLKINNDNKLTQDLFFEKGKMLHGVNFVTLFKNSKPIAERKFFISKPEKETAILINRVSSSIDSISFSINTKNYNFKPVSTKLSIATVSENSKIYNETQNIKSAFLLSPYINGDIENPAYYFDINNGDKKNALDLLLLNQGWSNYTLEEKVNKINPEKTFEFDYGFNIAGSISKYPKKHDIILLSKTNKIASFSKIENNNYVFKNVFAYKNDTVRIALVKGKLPLVKPKKVSFLDPYYSKEKNYKYLTNPIKTITSSNKTITEQKTTINSITPSIINYPNLNQLNTVYLKDVKAKKEDYEKDTNLEMAIKRQVIARGFYQGTKVTEKLEETYLTLFDYFISQGFITGVATSTAEYYVTIRKAVLQFSGSNHSNASANPDGTIPPIIYIDETPINKASNIDVLRSLYMSNVDEILINKLGAGQGLNGGGGVIKIYLKKEGHPSLQDTTEELYQNLVLLTGFNRAKSYYKPIYDLNKESLDWIEIDWKNQIQTDTNGKAIFKIPANEFSEDFKFIINGLSDSGLLFHYNYISNENEF